MVYVTLVSVIWPFFTLAVVFLWEPPNSIYFLLFLYVLKKLRWGHLVVPENLFENCSMALVMHFGPCCFGHWVCSLLFGHGVCTHWFWWRNLFPLVLVIVFIYLCLVTGGLLCFNVLSLAEAVCCILFASWWDMGALAVSGGVLSEAVRVWQGFSGPVGIKSTSNLWIIVYDCLRFDTGLIYCLGLCLNLLHY